MYENNMKKMEEDSSENDMPNITDFLLKDTISLRNEIRFTEIGEMVHPLTYSYDLKKHPNMNAIPVMDKSSNEKLKEEFLKTIE